MTAIKSKKQLIKDNVVRIKKELMEVHYTGENLHELKRI